MAKTKPEIAKKKKSSAAEAPASAKKKGFPAKKAGAKNAPAKKKKGLPLFKAPADFKPHFLLVTVQSEKDGLLGCNIDAVRYQGKFDRDAEDKKKFNMVGYDPKTLIGIQARLAAVTYKTNPDKKFALSPKERMDTKGGHRLPANTTFQVLLRVGKKAADQSLTAGVKTIWQSVTSAKTGRQSMLELDKKDPVYRALRKSSRILPAAFKEVLMPPKRGRKSQAEEE